MSSPPAWRGLATMGLLVSAVAIPSLLGGNTPHANAYSDLCLDEIDASYAAEDAADSVMVSALSEIDTIAEYESATEAAFADLDAAIDAYEAGQPCDAGSSSSASSDDSLLTALEAAHDAALAAADVRDAAVSSFIDVSSTATAMTEAIQNLQLCFDSAQTSSAASSGVSSSGASTSSASSSFSSTSAFSSAASSDVSSESFCAPEEPDPCAAKWAAYLVLEAEEIAKRRLAFQALTAYAERLSEAKDAERAIKAFGLSGLTLREFIQTYGTLSAQDRTAYDAAVLVWNTKNTQAEQLKAAWKTAEDVYRLKKDASFTAWKAWDDCKRGR